MISFLHTYRDIHSNCTEKQSIEDINKLVKELYSIKKEIYSYFQKIIYLEEPFYCLTVFIELYTFWKFSAIINDKIIILIIGNIIIFYSFLEKKYPKFLFRCRMFVKEVIEGIIGFIMALIPKYENEKNIHKK